VYHLKLDQRQAAAVGEARQCRPAAAPTSSLPLSKASTNLKYYFRLSYFHLVASLQSFSLAALVRRVQLYNRTEPNQVNARHTHEMFVQSIPLRKLAPSVDICTETLNFSFTICPSPNPTRLHPGCQFVETDVM